MQIKRRQVIGIIALKYENATLGWVLRPMVADIGGAKMERRDLGVSFCGSSLLPIFRWIEQRAIAGTACRKAGEDGPDLATENFGLRSICVLTDMDVGDNTQIWKIKWASKYF